MASPTAEDDCEGGASVVDGPVADRADHGGVAVPGDHGLTIITYTVEPHTASEQALNFLASWSAEASAANPRESETIEETK